MGPLILAAIVFAVVFVGGAIGTDFVGIYAASVLRSVAAPSSYDSTPNGLLSGRCSARGSAIRLLLRRPRSLFICRWRSRPIAFHSAWLRRRFAFIASCAATCRRSTFDVLAFPAVFMNAARTKRLSQRSADGGSLLEMDQDPQSPTFVWAATAIRPHWRGHPIRARLGLSIDHVDRRPAACGCILPGLAPCVRRARVERLLRRLVVRPRGVGERSGRQTRRCRAYSPPIRLLNG